MPKSDRLKLVGISHQLQTVLDAHPTSGRRWVALSGGVDSTVLLHLLARLPASKRVHAVHVHHGLQAVADRWVTHCQQLCERLHTPLEIRYVDATPTRGESPEAAARAARYRAFESLLEAQDQLLTAHHQQDQAETFLLRALRGSGSRGLAAMRVSRPLGQGVLLRPLLSLPQQALIDYAEAEALSWIEDPSNQQLDADRNFLRQQILPRLQERWPAAAATLSRSAAHCAESDGLLQQWGSVRLDGLRKGEPLPLITGEPLLECKASVRSWLDLNRVDPPDTAHMERILQELIPAREDATPLVEWRGIDGAKIRLRRFQQALYIEPPQGEVTLQGGELWDWREPLRLTQQWVLRAEQTEGVGLSLSALQGRPLTVRWRCGGERCQPAGSTHRRTLKNILRERKVPPWERSQIPLLFIGDELVEVVGHFICEGFAATAQEPAVAVKIVEKVA